MNHLNVDAGGAIPLKTEPLRVVNAVSPTVDLERVEDGVEITVHDIHGEQTEMVHDGDPAPVLAFNPPPIVRTQQGQSILADAVYIPFAAFQGGERIPCTATYKSDSELYGITVVITQPTEVKDGMICVRWASMAATRKPGSITFYFAFGGMNVQANVPMVYVFHGAKGDPGDDGYSPTAAVTKSGKTATITITDKTGTTTATVSDGQDGDPGDPGADGTTYTPSVSESGDLSWTNDGGKENPSTVNIKGPQGDDYVLTAQDKADIAAIVFPDPVNVSGSTPTITAEAGQQYICGEVATISITPPASGCCDIVFESGSTPAVLTVPATVKWPAWFDPTALEANATYEINILNGMLGAVGVWT